MTGSLSLPDLLVAQDANAAAYRRAVQASAPGDCWDFLILTATNEKQAEGYRQELALRHRSVGPTGAFFPAIQKSIVVADPPGPRIGSGGATLNALRALIGQFNLRAKDFDQYRILLIHSGGLSQRLPAYSALGKIFAPVPLLRPDGQIATLFDQLYLTAAGLPDRIGPGLFISSGDVVLLFDHRHVTQPKPGVSALTFRVDAEIAQAHGIFVAGASGAITKTLQKVPPEIMRAAGAMDQQDQVLIDTGLLFFDPASTRILTGLAGAFGKKRPALHEKHKRSFEIYEDTTAALSTSAARAQFPSALHRELYRALLGTPFHAMEMAGEFLHLGTTRQFRDAMIGQHLSPAAELFQHNVLAHSTWPVGTGRRVYHSVLTGDGAAQGELGEGCVVEHSTLRGATKIGAGSVVSQVAADRAFTLPSERLLFQVPLQQMVRSADPAKTKGLIAHVLCGVNDDFKGKVAEKKCAYLNEPIEKWLKRTGIKAEDLWKGIAADQRSLWNARLFVATENRTIPAMTFAITSGRAVTAAQRNNWRKATRFSMAEILSLAEPTALIEHRERVAAELQAEEMTESIRRREDSPIAERFGHYTSSGAYQAGESILRKFADAPTGDANLAIDQARALWSAAQLVQRPDHPGSAARGRMGEFMAGAFGKVALASELGYHSIRVAEKQSKVLPPGSTVTAASPVRIEFAGGWTDTPPYCFERGGHVVNVAMNLDGRAPVRAIVRTLREPKLVVESHDLGKSAEIKAGDKVGDVRDPFALHKIALQLTGFLPAVSKRPGLHVTTECRVPKGSGLGTSSILTATLLAALHRVRNYSPSQDELFEQTLLLEQRLSTGGGWQDQAGGIVGGVKSTITSPGVPQRPVVERLALSDATFKGLEDRLVVYFSGQQRLARDILRRVLGRWLGREPACIALMEDLRRNARNLRAAMLRGHWLTIAREISRYWQIKKELYPGTTTPTIDVLLLELRGLYLSAGLAGAGGGGFVYFFCKDAKQAHKLRETLAQRSARPGSLGAVYETQINRTGLRVTVE
jgi:fucokinase